jgi:hypothetical protein
METSIRGCEILDRDEMLPMYHGKKHEAGVDGRIADVSLTGKLAEHDRARAAVAFSTTFLHAFVGRKATKVIEDGGGGSALVAEFDVDKSSIQYELD